MIHVQIVDGEDVIKNDNTKKNNKKCSDNNFDIITS